MRRHLQKFGVSGQDWVSMGQFKQQRLLITRQGYVTDGIEEIEQSPKWLSFVRD